MQLKKKSIFDQGKKKNCSWYLYILFFKPVHSKKRQSLLLDLSFTLIMNSLQHCAFLISVYVLLTSVLLQYHDVVSLS